MIDKNYIKTLEAQKVTKSYIRTTKWVLERLDKYKAIETINKNDLLEFFKNFQGTEQSSNLFKTITKKYFNFIDKSELIDWIKAKKPKETLNPKDILTTEDINKLIDATDSHYYKALIAFLFETGCRISEARALKYKDLIETDKGLTVNLKTTKTNAGYRNLILPFSAQYLHNLKTYTNKNDNNIIFEISISPISIMLKKIGEKAGIDKPITCHKFRHAQATDMVKRGYAEAITRKKLGWTQSSNMIARYQHIDDNDVINATLEKSGKLPPTSKDFNQIKEAEKLNIVDQGMILSKLINENDEIKNKFEEYNQRIEIYQQRLTEYLEDTTMLLNYCLKDKDNFYQSEVFKHLRKVKNDW